jgi:hypothetical protein
VVGACASIAVTGLLQPAVGGWQYALPIGVAVLLLLGLVFVADPVLPGEPEPHRGPSLAGAVVASVLLVGLVAVPRFRVGRPLLSYTTRAAMALADARALADQPPARSTRLAVDFAAAQASVPAGARVGLFVDRADLVRYDTHPIIDLQTATMRRCLAWWGDTAAFARPPASCRRATLAVRALEVRYLLVASSALPARVPPEQRGRCTTDDGCPDPMTRLASRGARRDFGGVAVIELPAD